MTTNEIDTMIKDLMECFATDDTMIDTLHPITGLTVCFGRTLEETRAAKPEYANAQKMTVAEFCEKKAKRQRTLITWQASTEERYDNMLECLPPEMMLRGGFLVGEPSDHDAGTGQPRFEAFRVYGGAYLQGSRPMTRAEFKKEMEGAK